MGEPASLLRWAIFATANHGVDQYAVYMKSLWLARKLRRPVNALVGSPIITGRVRRVILVAWGVQCRTSAIRERCFFGGPRISIGKDTYINAGCFFEPWGEIIIGDGVSVGMNTIFTTIEHEIGPASRRAGEAIESTIRVGHGCWIGARVTVLSGVIIGNGCVIGAGAVVREDCAPNGVYVGIPARRVRDLPV